MNLKELRFHSLALKTVLVHTVTYFIMGIIAALSLDYAGQFADPAMHGFMRQVSDPLVAAGPLFQPLRGLLFACAFFPLRGILFGQKNGWLILWLVLTVIGILSPFGPAIGSIEGLVYTTVPVWMQLRGLPEVVIQALLLSWLLSWWINNPGKKWIGVTLWILFGLIVFFSALGIILPR